MIEGLYFVTEKCIQATENGYMDKSAGIKQVYKTDLIDKPKRPLTNNRQRVTKRIIMKKTINTVIPDKLPKQQFIVMSLKVFQKNCSF